MPIVWIFGGSGKLGSAVSEILHPTHNVVSISRSGKAEDSETRYHYALDLSNDALVKDAVPHLKELYFPRAIVFCQRYRPAQNANEIDMTAALNTEILSPQKIIEETCKATSRGPLSIVLVSSVNGNFINSNMPFWYHWLKSSQIQLMKYYSSCKQPTSFNMNCIAAGTFLKAPFETYPVSYRILLDALQNTNGSRKICTIQEIGRIIEFLISDQAMCINGQTITLDGGLTNRLQEELIQNYDHQKR